MTPIQEKINKNHKEIKELNSKLDQCKKEIKDNVKNLEKIIYDAISNNVLELTE